LENAKKLGNRRGGFPCHEKKKKKREALGQGVAKSILRGTLADRGGGGAIAGESPGRWLRFKIWSGATRCEEKGKRKGDKAGDSSSHSPLCWQGTAGQKIVAVKEAGNPEGVVGRGNLLQEDGIGGERREILERTGATV